MHQTVVGHLSLCGWWGRATTSFPCGITEFKGSGFEEKSSVLSILKYSTTLMGKDDSKIAHLAMHFDALSDSVTLISACFPSN